MDIVELLGQYDADLLTEEDVRQHPTWKAYAAQFPGNDLKGHFHVTEEGLAEARARLSPSAKLTDKLFEGLKPDGTHYSWLFTCPGCEMPHSCNERWVWNGSREKPTFDGSVLVEWQHGPDYEPRRCHSFVRDGRIEFLADCTHPLAGQTVDLPPWGGF